MFVAAECNEERGGLKEETTAAKTLLEILPCDLFRVLVPLLRPYFVERGKI